MSDIAIQVQNLSKCYQIYDSPRDRLKQFVVPRLQRLVGQAPKQYFREFWALRDVSFEVKKGETVGIIGRNGSGKSTLLQMICGTLSPTSGNIQTKGRIAALLELGSGFNPEFSGRENVYMNAVVLGLSKEEIDERFDAIAAFADIGDFIEQPVKIYSSGMLVRLAFAVSVSVNPDILVVDEALAVGDMAFQQKCLQRLADLRELGTTILMVTHDIMLIRNYCTRSIYLERGQVKMIGDTETVGERYVHDMFAERQGTQDGNAIEWRSESENGRISFGTSRGRVSGVRIHGERSPGQTFQQGETISVEIGGEVDMSVANPEFVFQLRDARGYVLYGISSRAEDLSVIEGQVSKEIRACLSFRANLAPGNYAVTIGFNDRLGANLVSVLDKVVAVVEFSIAASVTDRFHGCINLHGTWNTRTLRRAPEGGRYGGYDIGEECLRAGLARNMAPHTLQELVAVSRSLFGWFNRRVTRCDEYVWIVNGFPHDRMMYIADIGAGISPLPVYLAGKGHKVLTVDSSPIVRIHGKDEETWNGWGYLDYSRLHSGITSMNCDAAGIPQDGQQFDLCYSVSVIEHLAADARRGLLHRLAAMIKADGNLMLTVDLIPDSFDLWNMEQGREVESIAQHGNIDDLLKELLDCGFGIVETRVLRDYPDDPRSDIALIHCRRTNK